jgi:SAM-dependent methyltransferase
MQPGAERVIWQQADASSLPFPDQHFDAVVCQFGAMFFPDKLLAFGEALRVLRPGGRFVFNVWDHMECNPLFDVLRQMVTDLFPDNPPHVPSLAWSYCDPATLRADLKGECPANGGMTTQEIRSVGSIADRGNGDAMGVAVDCDGG